MSTALWRSSLARALHHNRSLPYSRYVQLATVQPSGRPANRTIVFRGFLEHTDQLQFVTDARSEKINQIERLPWGELCWYFANTREQFRLTGRLTLVQAEHIDSVLVQARQQIWQDLSDATRTQFSWPHPGQTRTENDAFQVSLPDKIMPLPNFCLLLLNPTQVDHLELRGNPQNRRLYRYDGTNWSTQEINP